MTRVVRIYADFFIFIRVNLRVAAFHVAIGDLGRKLGDLRPH